LRVGRRKFISGFSGSAGTALIGEEKAYLWTDARYFLQAETELSGRPDGESWELMRSGQRGVLEPGPFLVNLHAKSTAPVKVGVDSSFITAAAALALVTAFKGTQLELVPVKGANLVDRVWAMDPSCPQSSTTVVPCVPHPVRYAGKTHSEKIGLLQAQLRESNAYATVVSMLDEVAWLFNIRGGDVPCNPVSLCYAVVTVADAHIFIDQRKLLRSTNPETDIHSHLAGAGIQVHSYEDVDSFLWELYQDCERVERKVFCDFNHINYSIYTILSRGGKGVLINNPSLIALPKAIKNAAEVEGAREAHVRDGVALTAFLYWLEERYSDPDASTVALLTEFEVGEVLEGFRTKVALFRNPSFETIAGYGPNGAIVHYRAKENDSLVVGTGSFLLLDSGGQYLDGTTDVTRTVALGSTALITVHMRRCYSLVLKGHIALAGLQFPMGTKGSVIDAMARMHLWQHGLDYGHGTGHGVGSFLNVHEGPQGIGFRPRVNEAVS
jgi:Xaa-Pro aminopeptidase